MSLLYRPLCPARHTFAMFFAICTLMLSSSTAWALAAESLDVETFAATEGNNIVYNAGTLTAQDGFQTQIGYTFLYTSDFATPADLAAIDSKTVIQLSLWNEQNDSNGGNYLVNFPHSAETYTIQGSVYVIVTVVGGSTPPPDPNAPDTKPILNSIDSEWDAEAGQPFTGLVLQVNDAESDTFKIIGGPKGSTFSDPYDQNQLPTVDFQWTPKLTDANKVITVKFKAKETAHKRLTSNTVTAKIRVWPAGGQTDAASVSKFSVSTVKWSADLLTLTGKIVLNKIMSADQRAAFFAKKLDLTLTAGTTGTGPAVGSSPLQLTLSDKGMWSVTMPLPEAEVPCKITLQYEGRPAARKVARAPKGCLK